VEFGRGQGLGGASGFEGDGFQVVKAFTITYDVPVRMGLGQCAVHLWMERMGSTSATLGYRVCSDESRTTHAHGTRTVVCLDSTTLRPTPWSHQAREVSRTIERPKSSDQPGGDGARLLMA
jgi:acyl-CoA thioester hydrolase